PDRRPPYPAPARAARGDLAQAVALVHAVPPDRELDRRHRARAAAVLPPGGGVARGAAWRGLARRDRLEERQASSRGFLGIQLPRGQRRLPCRGAREREAGRDRRLRAESGARWEAGSRAVGSRVGGGRVNARLMARPPAAP